MSAAAVITSLRLAGCALEATPDGRIDIEVPENAPGVDDLLTQLRDVKAEALAILRGPVCLDCSATVPETDLFCDPCYQARKLVPFEEMTRRRTECRQHTIERLRDWPCPDCGSSRWHVNARGDAWCLTCFERGREVKS